MGAKIMEIINWGKNGYGAIKMYFHYLKWKKFEITLIQKDLHGCLTTNLDRIKDVFYAHFQSLYFSTCCNVHRLSSKQFTGA